MKRSEMLQEIQKQIETEVETSSLEDFHPPLLAEIILMRMEELGMLPPKVEVSIGKHSTIDHLWEPEEPVQLNFALDETSPDNEFCCERGCGECLTQ